MNDGARLVGEGARLTAEGGSLYESNRPDGMGNGERHKIWRARSGEESVIESTKRTDTVVDAAGDEAWIVMRYGAENTYDRVL